MIFQFFVLLTLIYSSYQDYKTRIIPNTNILMVWLLLIPSILSNTVVIPHVIIIVNILMMYRYLHPYGFGGADLKTLTPLILSMSIGMVYLFLISVVVLSTVCYLVFRFKLQPLFIPITIAYLIILISQNLTSLYISWYA